MKANFRWGGEEAEPRAKAGWGGSVSAPCCAGGSPTPAGRIALHLQPALRYRAKRLIEADILNEAENLLYKM